MLKGNKGDWTELYVFAKLLSEGRLFQAEIDLKPSKNIYYEIVKVYRLEGELTLEFDRKEFIEIYSVVDGNRSFVRSFTLAYLREVAEKVYAGIANGTGKSFAIPNVNEFIEEGKIQRLRAGKDDKTDIRLRIYDHRLGKEADLGFSIKSFMGQNATLFNTGNGNNFIYGIKSTRSISIAEFNRLTYQPLGGVSKLTDRLNKLQFDYSATINFKAIQSSQLWRNLRMVDGDLPQILAYCLLYRWIDRVKSVVEVVKILEERDPLNFYQGEVTEQRLYEYKIKKFLVDCALGMTSEKPWHGVYDATGGAIICKQDGEIVCFHIYDFNLFREYLLNNTIFEQPSTGEDKYNPGTARTTKGTKKYYYGWLYQENDELLFKINLQIRFE